jgi:hypothetical protein
MNAMSGEMNAIRVRLWWRRYSSVCQFTLSGPGAGCTRKFRRLPLCSRHCAASAAAFCVAKTAKHDGPGSPASTASRASTTALSHCSRSARAASTEVITRQSLFVYVVWYERLCFSVCLFKTFRSSSRWSSKRSTGRWSYTGMIPRNSSGNRSANIASTASVGNFSVPSLMRTGTRSVIKTV